MCVASKMCSMLLKFKYFYFVLVYRSFRSFRLYRKFTLQTMQRNNQIAKVSYNFQH